MRHLIKLGAIIAGATAGAAVGVLLAPDKGSKIRNKISDQLKSSADTLSSSKETLKNRFLEFVSSKEEDFETGLTSVLNKAGNKTEEVISVLEQKLAELKDDKKMHHQTTQPKSINDDSEDVVLKAAYTKPKDL